ncbi:MAG: aminoacyl-tRNA hydrolase [Collinsella sp.]|nr:aminoacyl-tRNA hydrolase [Collinsella sp.]
MPAAQPKKIRMVAGLGNPGDEYARTRHNAGFHSVDELARQAHVTYWKNQSGAEVASINVADADEETGRREVLLVKPQSYMNTSGGPISKICAAHKIAPEEVLVIHDELDIPEGDVRLKVGGGHAGHNGLRSIIDKLGSRDFSRVRVGIGDPPGRMPVADFVLKQFRPKELEEFNETCCRAADAAGLALVRGIIFARDHVNGAASKNGKH